MNVKEKNKIRGSTSVEHGERAANELPDRVRDDFFKIVEPSLYITTQEEFFKWTQNELQGIFPHEKLVCGVGRLGKNGVQIRHVMGCNFPDEYVEALKRPDGLTSSPIILKWMKEQQPILFDPDCTGPHCNEIRESAPPGWLDNFRRFELRNLAAHGLRDVENHTASYFSFSSIPAPLTERHAYLLKLLVPHMHVSLSRVVSNPRFGKRPSTSQHVVLSPREKEILQWMSSGKSNWEISQVVGLSESTVKNHVHRILGKMHAATRAQAVAKAIHLKLINGKH